jgi:tRNA (guanine-N7-)-methyltransferase
MRIKRKKSAKPELESCNFFVDHPEEYKSNWHEQFPKKQKIHLELGCGKGGFISKLALDNPNTNFIAIDNKNEILALAKKKIETAYHSQNQEVHNIKLLSKEIMNMGSFFSHEDTVERIYINFSNPWYKNRHRKRRLTHPNQLNQYRNILMPAGEIWFKTDYKPFFKDSVSYFTECGFDIIYRTEDLHKSDFQGNIRTEYEDYFLERGTKICFLIAKKQEKEISPIIS